MFRWKSAGPHLKKVEGVRIVKVPQFGVIATHPLLPPGDVYKDRQEADLIHIHCPNFGRIIILMAPKNCRL